MKVSAEWLQGALSVVLIIAVIASGWREMVVMWRRKVLGQLPEVETPAVIGKRVRRLAAIYLMMLVVSLVMVANIVMFIGVRNDPFGIAVYVVIAWHSRKMLSAMIGTSKRMRT